MSHKTLSEEEYFEKTRKRLKESVIIDDNGCWIWQKWITSDYKYGNASFRRNANHRSHKAHRVAWMVWRGDIPDGLFVFQKCGVHQCINPDHLHLGTHYDRSGKNNTLKGCKGEENCHAVLTEDNVRKIRSLWKDGLSQKYISEIFSVALSTIHRIVRRKRWKHVK